MQLLEDKIIEVEMKGFYAGVSVPVNDKLTEIFVQLHIREKSGRGVPRIVGEYGEKAFDFSNNAIKVTIPYNRLNLGGIPQVTPPRSGSGTWRYSRKSNS